MSRASPGAFRIDDNGSSLLYQFSSLFKSRAIQAIVADRNPAQPLEDVPSAPERETNLAVPGTPRAVESRILRRDVESWRGLQLYKAARLPWYAFHTNGAITKSKPANDTKQGPQTPVNNGAHCFVAMTAMSRSMTCSMLSADMSISSASVAAARGATERRAVTLIPGVDVLPRSVQLQGVPGGDQLPLAACGANRAIGVEKKLYIRCGKHRCRYRGPRQPRVLPNLCSAEPEGAIHANGWNRRDDGSHVADFSRSNVFGHVAIVDLNTGGRRIGDDDNTGLLQQPCYRCIVPRIDTLLTDFPCHRWIEGTRIDVRYRNASPPASGILPTPATSQWR